LAGVDHDLRTVGRRGEQPIWGGDVFVGHDGLGFGGRTAIDTVPAATDQCPDRHQDLAGTCPTTLPVVVRRACMAMANGGRALIVTLPTAVTASGRGGWWLSPSEAPVFPASAGASLGLSHQPPDDEGC
jgi:hypothetical protein